MSRDTVATSSRINQRFTTMKRCSAFLTFAALALIVSTSADATTMLPLSELPSMTTTVADGCGPNGWRGPWGHCHFRRFYGGPGWYGRAGWYGGGPGWGNACPPGFWRGPWGHCRDTPYHGRLPGGGWKP
jgi:hypothetical protein